MRVIAVTCHLHFWQNDRDFFTCYCGNTGWNGYRNKSQHRKSKSTLEKKILPPFQQGFEPATFQSRVRRSNHWAIPAPKIRFLTWTYIYVHGFRGRVPTSFSLCYTGLFRVALGSCPGGTWPNNYVFCPILLTGFMTIPASLVSTHSAVQLCTNRKTNMSVIRTGPVDYHKSRI